MSSIASNLTWYQVNSPDAWTSGTYDSIDTINLAATKQRSVKVPKTHDRNLTPDAPVDTWFQLPSNTDSGNQQLNWDAYVVMPLTRPPAEPLLPSSPWEPCLSLNSTPSSPKKSKDKSSPTLFRPPQRNIDIEAELSRQNLYKTELCRSWVESDMCKYGTKCQFAHGKHELRPVFRHPKYKTEICKTFHTNGTCPYGRRCRFVHNPTEQRIPGDAISDNEDGDFVPDIVSTPPEEDSEEQQAIEEKIAQLRLSSLLAPDPVYTPPAVEQPQPVSVTPPKKTGSRLPFFQKLRKQKT